MNDREGVADGFQAENPLLGVLVTLFKWICISTCRSFAEKNLDPQITFAFAQYVVKVSLAVFVILSALFSSATLNVFILLVHVFSHQTAYFHLFYLNCHYQPQ